MTSSQVAQDEEDSPHPAPSSVETPFLLYPLTSATHNATHFTTTGTSRRDLSNLKLAQNQIELSKQIVELSTIVQMQGKLLERLLTALDVDVGKDAASNINEGREGKQTQFVVDT